jgi:hypothetical protein
MLIMQTFDAKGRRRYIEEKGLGKVIFSHELEESVCLQYHPKGVKGISRHAVFSIVVWNMDLCLARWC